MSLAIIAPITVSKHPNADRLQLGDILGNQVVVGMETKTGDLGIFFPEGLQLSPEYAAANDLVRRKNPDGSHAGGFFEEKRRVRCQKFRGTKSEGYFAPLSSLAFTGDISGLKVGDRLDEVNGVKLCQKYITPATQAAREKNRSSSRRETTMFKAHFDTDQLKFNKYRIQPGLNLIATLKMHGTSQRTGYVKDEIKLPLWKRLVNYIRPTTFATEKWTYLSGSRNVILDRQQGKPYHDPSFREQAAVPFKDKLHKGETVFYEIVGYEKIDVPVMDKHHTAGLQDKLLQRMYGDEITYHYGCMNGMFEVYVYRITMTNEDGVSIDLPWASVKARCAELGVKHVPEMPLIVPDRLEGEEFVEAVMDNLNFLIEGPDPVGKTHPTEGICLRIEGGGQSKAQVFKHKSFTFGLLEGYIKESNDYVDAEEIA